MQAGTFRPCFTRQMIGAKYLVNERKYGGEVLAVIFWILTMVPMMILWCGNDVFQKPKIDAGVGMDQYRMDRHENYVGIKRYF